MRSFAGSPCRRNDTMKTKTLFPILIVLAVCVAAYSETTVITTAPTTTATVQVTTEALRFRSAFFSGLKNARTNNTGTVWIQFAGTTNSAAIKLLGGQSATLTLPGTEGMIASNLWLHVETADDGIVAIFFE